MPLRRAALPLLFASIAVAQTPPPASPTSGDWKGQPIGAFTVSKITSRPSSTQPSTDVYRRTLLVGSVDGLARFEVSESATEHGPWTPKYGTGDARMDGASEQKETIAHETINVSGRSVACVVTRTVLTTDSSIVESESWETETGLRLKFTSRSRSRDEDKPAVISVESDFDGFTSSTVSGQPVEGWCVRGKQLLSREFAAVEQILSDKVPGRRLSYTRWRTEDRTQPPVYVETVLSTGVDAPAALASHFIPRPPPEPENVSRQRFLEAALAEAASPEATTREHGLRTLGMNDWTDAQRQQLAVAVSSGLADPDAAVRRAAAKAAGWNRTPNTAALILDAMANEPKDKREYIAALGALADPKGLDAIIQGVNDRDLQGEAVAALAAFDLPQATEALDRVIPSLNSSRQQNLARAMARLRTRHSLELLMQWSSSTDKGVRISSLQALSERADPAAFDVLLKAVDAPPLPQDRDDLARSAAIMALGRSAGPNQQRVADLLAERLPTAAPGLRMPIVLVLSNFNDDRALPTLRQMIARPNDFADRLQWAPADITAVAMLCRIGTPAAMDELLATGREPAHTELALNQMRQSKSPFVARAAWRWYQQAITEPAPATQPTSPFGGTVERLIQIVQAQADKPLRDELEAAIPKADVRRRPALRRVVREIDRRLATAPATSPRPN